MNLKKASIILSIIVVLVLCFFLYRYSQYVYCNVCKQSFKEFRPFGVVERPNALCPNCKVLERHRLLLFYLKEKFNFFTEKNKVLHVGPNLALQKKFKAMKNLDYVSIDIMKGAAMLQMDLMDLKFPDNSFDVVLCYHVLEHVYDDQKAMSEILRVLKPGGYAILQSYMDYSLEKTSEDVSVTDPKERERLFGQDDHFRAYGDDYKEILEQAGFIVTKDDYVKNLPRRMVKKHALDLKEDIYYCEKPKK